ncbi:MAG: hypothetical protein VB857_06860, partial [Pirellulaceae bacterium]
QLEAAAQQPQASARKKAFAKLAENQQRLGQQVSSLVTKLRQLGAQRSADGVQSAGEQMDLTAEAIRQDLGKQAVAGSQLSEQKLAAAQQQLLRDIFQVEHGLLRQQLDRLKEQLVTMLQQQQEILVETSALDTLRIVDPQRRLTRVQRGVLKRLAERQRQLALDGLTSARLLERSEAFRFGLQAAGRKMTRAADDLAAELTDKLNAQTAQLQAVAQLQRLLQALQTKVDTGETQGAEPQATTDQQRPGAASPRSLSELILLELMQRNINQQTEELAKARMAAGTWTKKQQLQYAELARQQGQLAAIVDRLRGDAVQPAKESKDE